MPDELTSCASCFSFFCLSSRYFCRICFHSLLAATRRLRWAKFPRTTSGRMIVFHTNAASCPQTSSSTTCISISPKVNQGSEYESGNSTSNHDWKGDSIRVSSDPLTNPTEVHCPHCLTICMSQCPASQCSHTVWAFIAYERILFSHLAKQYGPQIVDSWKNRCVECSFTKVV